MALPFSLYFSSLLHAVTYLNRMRPGEESIVVRGQISILPFPECLSGDGSLHLKIFLQQYSHSVEEKDGTASNLEWRKRIESNNIGKDALKLCKSRALTDFRIQTRDGKTFDVHKAILGGQNLN
jgi:hypothetical protein